MGTGDRNTIVLDTDGNILGVAVDWNLVYEDDSWNGYLFEEGGARSSQIAIVAVIVEPAEP